MKNLLHVVIVAALATLFAPHGPVAQDRGTDRYKQREACTTGDAASKIRECTVLIESESESPSDRADFLYNRGIAYQTQGRRNLAIADYDDGTTPEAG